MFFLKDSRKSDRHISAADGLREKAGRRFPAAYFFPAASALLAVLVMGAGLLFGGCGKTAGEVVYDIESAASAEESEGGETGTSRTDGEDGSSSSAEDTADKEDVPDEDSAEADSSDGDSAGETTSGGETAGSPDAGAVKAAASNGIYVYICGEVVNPGVYRMEEGARLFEVIEKAGGLTGMADPRSINQAQTVSDGQEIIVYAVGETPGAAADTAGSGSPGSAEGEADGSGLVNINTAPADTLMTLPGIGEVKAQAIIEYRTKNGPFKSIDELTSVSGIGEGLYSRIKSQITI